jgi:hypothetical protein
MIHPDGAPCNPFNTSDGKGMNEEPARQVWGDETSMLVDNACMSNAIQVS